MFVCLFFILQNVKYLIQLYNSSTPEVVEQYFIEKLNEQVSYHYS